MTTKKARIKRTGEIVELTHDDILYLDICQDDLEEIELIDEPDYWDKLKHQYAGMAMQGILSNPNHALWERENNAEGIAESANRIATALVEKLKGNNNY